MHSDPDAVFLDKRWLLAVGPCMRKLAVADKPVVTCRAVCRVRGLF